MVGAIGSKAHMAAVKDACKSAESIHRALHLTGRSEIALVSGEPDFFNPSVGWTKVRQRAWEVMSQCRSLRWVIPTCYPENVNLLESGETFGIGHRDLCVGLVADAVESFPKKLQALRDAKVQHRMLLLRAPRAEAEFVADLGGIDWVILVGEAADVTTAASIREVCRQAGVAFLFHQTDKPSLEPFPAEDAEDEPYLNLHPFGDKLILSRPTLSDLGPWSLDRLALPDPIAPFSIIHDGAEEHSGNDSTATIIVEQASAESKDEHLNDADRAASSLQGPGSPLGPPDAQDLTEFRRLDEVVRLGLEAFIEVGSALMEIRDRELWRAGGCESWAAYCQGIGGLTKTHANRLIKSAAVADHLAKVTPIGVTPRSESQVRPLTKLKLPDQQVLAWTRATGKALGQPTATLVSQCVADILAGEATAKLSGKTCRKEMLRQAFSNLRNACKLRSSVAHDHEIEKHIHELETLLRLG